MAENKIPEWTAKVVGLMHIHKISINDVANKIGCRREYISRLLNGSEHRTNAEEYISTAVNELIKNREE